MSDTENEYSIQEAAEVLGIPIQKLRRWDEQGVLVALRTGGGHRRYSKEVIDRLAAVAPAGSEKSSRELATVKRSLAEKRRVIQLLLESENRYRDLVETSHDLIWATDSQGRFTYLNNASVEIFGLAPRDMIGRCFFNFEAGAAHVSNRRFLATLWKSGEVKNHVSHLLTAQGEDRWIGINARVTHDEHGEPLGIRGTARDITEQHLGALRIEQLALYDTLTDLPNRHSLQRRIEASTADGRVGALLLLDLDHFKYVNDKFGHRAGDQMLIGISSVLRDTVRARQGEIYRMGGDEFAIHLPDALRREAVEVAEHALDAVRGYRFQANEHKVLSNVSASVGIALYPFHGNDLPGLLSNVDIAMYRAKDLGRNRYAVFDQASDSLRSTHRRVHWSKKLRDALDEDRITLFAQPVVRLADARPVNLEILARIREDDGSHILPGDFVNLAESLGMMQEIDMRVVEKVLAHMAVGGTDAPHRRYFVNLSRVSIADQRWVQRFAAMLKAGGVDPGRLVFEITENAAMAEVDVTLGFVRRLKDLGCRFALDDFGAGFSSFYYLRRFEVDYLKVNGGFVRDMATDDSNRLFVRALNDIALGLNKQVIASWVESPEAVALLQAAGTLYGQGYLFQKPQALAADAGAPVLARTKSA